MNRSNSATVSKTLLLSLLMTCGCLVAEVRADTKCIKHEAHESITYFVIDRTDEISDLEPLQQTIHTVNEMVKPGERLVLGTSSGQGGQMRVLLDLVRPAKDLWESPMKLKAREKDFARCLTDVENQLISTKESSPTSALIETIIYTSKVLTSDTTASARRLILFSDMVQNSPLLSFLGKNPIDSDSAFKKIKKDGVIPDLSGVAVYVSGTGMGVTDQRAMAIEKFWNKFMEDAKADLKFYGPLLPGA